MFHASYLATALETVDDVIADAKAIWPGWPYSTLPHEIATARDRYLGASLLDLLELRIRAQRRQPDHPSFALATWIAWRAYRAAGRGRPSRC